MSVALLSIQPDGIEVGIVGDPIYQKVIRWDPKAGIESLKDTLKLQNVIREALDTLLMAYHLITVVILEPPLLTLPIKQALADVLLGRFRVFAVGFLQQSVCCIAGHKLAAGVVIDRNEKVVVPVYDYRELTPFIVPLDELEPDEAIKRATSKAAIDIRRPLRENVIENSSREAWLGASALTSQRTVWPLITREKYTQGRKIWDSLFDMR